MRVVLRAKNARVHWYARTCTRLLAQLWEDCARMPVSEPTTHLANGGNRFRKATHNSLCHTSSFGFPCLSACRRNRRARTKETRARIATVKFHACGPVSLPLCAHGRAVARNTSSPSSPSRSVVLTSIVLLHLLVCYMISIATVQHRVRACVGTSG